MTDERRAPPALELRDVAASYGSARVLRGVSLSVREGERVALLGPSGCGKTTLLRLVAGLERPTAGMIAIAGRVVADGRRVSPPETRAVGLVFQEYALFPHLDARANVAFGLPRRARRGAGPEIAALFDRVGLGGLEGRFPHELSGGQRQRLALARALAPEPRLLLLDEPLSNLDAQLRVSLRRDLTRLIDDLGTTAILVTHDREEALAFAERVALLDRGEILQFGAARDIYGAPVSATAARLIGDANFVPGRARAGEVDTPLGRLHGEGPIGAASVLVRPEQLRLNGEGTPAIVEASEFAGPIVRIALRVEGVDVPLHTTAPTVDGPPVGARVGVGVAGAVRWFADDLIP